MNKEKKQQKEITKSEQRKIFLTTYIDTQHIADSARAAKVSYAVAAGWAKQYSNMLEAQFAGIGLSRVDVMKKHADMISNAPTRTRMTKFGKETNVDAGAHLKAIEMFYEVTGLKKTAPEVVIVNDVKSESNVELEIFKSLPEDVKKSVRDKILNAKKPEGEQI